MDLATGTLGGILVVQLAQLGHAFFKRRWDLADRLAREAKEIAAATDREKLTSVTAQIVELIKKAHDEITVNTKVSTEAFHEANGAKQLIADVNKSLGEEVRRRNDLAITAEAQAGLRDPLATARVIGDLRARLELLERRQHRLPRLKRPATKRRRSGLG